MRYYGLDTAEAHRLLDHPFFALEFMEATAGLGAYGGVVIPSGDIWYG